MPPFFHSSVAWQSALRSSDPSGRRPSKRPLLNVEAAGEFLHFFVSEVLCINAGDCGSLSSGVTAWVPSGEVYKKYWPTAYAEPTGAVRRLTGLNQDTEAAHETWEKFVD